MRMGLSGSVIRVAPGEGSRVPFGRTRVPAGLTASIMYTVISAICRASAAIALRPFMKRLLCLTVALACLAAAAFAQTSSNRDIYMYQGADRDKRLVAGAKKERQVVLYSTMTVADGKACGNAFERKYGVQLVHWRTSSEKIVQRAVAEARGRRYEADVFESSANHLEALRREKLLEDFHTPVLSEIVPAALPRGHRQYVADRF